MKISIIKIIIFIIFMTVILPGSALAATLSLSPTSGTFNKGCGFALTVTLDTGSGVQTDGTDAILAYDPTRFSATSILNGTIYSDYPGSNIDSTAGRVTISGLASVSSPFSGKGTLATINFTVADNAQAGATAVTFDFDPNNKAKTTDSNIVERGTVADVLSGVTNGSYIIGSGTCQGLATGPASGLPQGQTGLATPSARTRPATIDNLVDRTGKGPGTPQLTFTITIIGSVLTVLGILGLAFL